MSRCEDEQMWRWEDEKMWRWEDEKVWRWADVKMSRCEDVKMSRCEDEQMWRWGRCEDEKMWRWEDVKMRRCEDEKMWRWEDVKWEDVKMWRWEDVKWEDVKMRRCEDVQMRRWETDPHYWKNPALRRSREKNKIAKWLDLHQHLLRFHQSPWVIFNFGFASHDYSDYSVAIGNHEVVGDATVGYDCDSRDSRVSRPSTLPPFSEVWSTNRACRSKSYVAKL